MTLGIALLVFATAVGAGAQELTPQQRRGKQIFERGENGARQRITAILGGEETAVPATVAPCANCHGADGRSGNTESGITPPDITWDRLTRAYGGKPYDERLIRRAVSLGINSAGVRLYNAMPRYQMLYADMDDLIAYLKVVGTLAERGITDEEVHVGVILPPKGTMVAPGKAVQAALTTYFAEVNASGGIYGRRITLHTWEPPAVGDRGAAFAKFLDTQPLFALVSSFLAGAERDLTEKLRERRLPLVGAFTLFPQLEPLNPFVFYFYPGVSGETAALVKYASQQALGELALAHGGDAVFARSAEVAGAIRRFEVSDVSQTAKDLAEAKVKAAILLMPAVTAAALIREIARVQLRLTVLLPGSLVSADVLKAAGESSSPSFFAMPELSGEAAPGGAVERQAVACAKVLVEGLKQTGKQVTAARLVSSLEQLHDFASGSGPVVTFGPNRRVGVSGVRITRMDPATQRLRPVEVIQ